MSRHTEQQGVSPSSIASRWLDRRMSGVHAVIHQRLRKHVMLMTTGSALLSGIGAYSFSSIEPGLSALGVALPAIAASLITAAALYPVLRRREHWQLDALSIIAHSNIDLLSVLGKLTELRNGETAGHNMRVTLYTLMFAEALHLPALDTVRAVKGALLHDVGKLAMPDSILGKPGPLTPDERLEMNKHVRYGLEIISQSPILHEAASVVGGHHEHYDGRGYPLGLAGEAIPREARIFALVDVFDALTSSRVYKPTYDIEAALKIMAEGRGSQFDPTLLDCFMALAPDFARHLPKDEAALTKLLINRLLPYLELFVPEGPIPNASVAESATSTGAVKP